MLASLWKTSNRHVCREGHAGEAILPLSSCQQVGKLHHSEDSLQAIPDSPTGITRRNERGSSKS